MFYSVDLLRIRKKKKGRLPACWLAATTKNFIGTGSYKLSKQEVEDIDVYALCNDILDGILGEENTPRFSLYLSSQLVYGTLRIFQHQVDVLENACLTLCMKILNPTMPIKDKKLSKNINLLTDQEVEEVDLCQHFPKNPEDKHLIVEEDDFRIVMKSALEFDDRENDLSDIRGFEALPPLHEQNFSANIEGQQSPILEQEEISDRQKSPIIPKTPKRKSRKFHNETPTKRKRAVSELMPHTPISVAPVTSELMPTTPTSATRIRTSISFNPSELAKSPIATSSIRRSIFGGEISMNESAALPVGTSAHEVIGVLPMESTPPTESTGQQLFKPRMPGDENLNQLVLPELMDETVMPTVIENSIETSEHNFQPVELNELVQVVAAVPIQQSDHAALENDQRITPSNAANDFCLENLNELSQTLSTRNRKRAKPVLDRVTQIHLKEYNIMTHHTRTLISTQVDIYNKIPAKVLLNLPSTRLKEINISKFNCLWANVLQDHFSKMIKTHCSSSFEEDMQMSIPRDEGVNKASRLSRFKFAESSKTSSRQSSSKVHTTTDPISENENGQDSAPLFSSYSHQSPRIPRLTSGPDSSIVVPQVEHVPESEESFLPSTIQQSDFRILQSSINLQSSPETESQRDDLFLTMEEFDALLEKLWKILTNYLTSEDLIQFELDDILIPSDTSIEELIKYFIYLCEFEKKKKLYIIQNSAYEPIFIIKAESEFEESP